MYLKLTSISLLICIFHTSAHAYIDPGVGSIILQAIIGAIAATSLTIKIYWQKLSLFSRKIRIKTLSKDSYHIEPSSFRDNLGNIYYFEKKILRTIKTNGKQNFEFLVDNKILEESIKKKFLIYKKVIKKNELP